MGSNSLISICIPTYNGKQHIKECIYSAINQTYKNIEIIISDDNSQDDTIDISSSILGKTNIDYKIIMNNTSRGAANNWNNAIKNASGKYIKMLFQDDYLYLDCIEKMILLAESHKELEFIFSLRDPLNEKQIENDLETKAIVNFIIDQKKYLGNVPMIQSGLDLINNKYLLNGSNIIGEPSNILINKDVFKKIGYFNPSIIQLIDIEMWYRILLKYKVGFINESLSAFRIHDNQLSHKNKKFITEVENERFIILKSLHKNLIKLNHNKFYLSLLDENIRRISISNKVYWKVIKPFWKLYYSIRKRIFRFFYLRTI